VAVRASHPVGPIRAVTLDAAGTLIVPHPSVGAVYAEVAAEGGLERDAGQLERAFPAAFAAVRARWGVPYGRDEDDARRFWLAVVEATFGEPLPYEIACELYDTFARARRWRVLPGVREALDLLRAQGLPLAVVTNFDGRVVPLLAELELGPFAAVVTSARIGRPKPDPAALLAACAVLAVPPSAVLHLGDSEREDGGMCAAAGARWLPCAGGIPLADLRAILAQP
jgi:putative hydrolase of the HAD superfamily